MKILLTNDDGYTTPGIQTLYDILARRHTVVMIAPDREKSAVSHGITLNQPMRMEPIQLNGSGRGYAVRGTPADCVKLGLFEIFDTPPDLLISGINPGCNIGIDINYSGTVSAAREGTLNGIPSLAASIRVGKVMDFENMARFVAKTAEKVLTTGLPTGTFLNINAPDGPLDQVRGTKITRQSFKNISNRFDKRQDPKNRSYFWYSGQEIDQNDPDTDLNAVLNGYMSITPIRCDVTDYAAMAELATVDFA